MKATPVKEEWLDTSSSAPDHLKLPVQSKEIIKPNDDSRSHFSRDRFIQKLKPNFPQQPPAPATDRAQSCRDGVEPSTLRQRREFLNRISARPLNSKQTNRYSNTNLNGHQFSRRKNQSNNSARLNVHRNTVAPDRILPRQSQQVHHSPPDTLNGNTSGDGSSSTIQIICTSSKSSLANASGANSSDSMETFAASSPRHQRLIGEGSRTLPDEMLQEALTSFIRHLPNAWMLPILRAVTLQVMTERLPMRIMSSSVIFDAYSEAKGELVHVLKSSGVPLGNTMGQLTKLSPNDRTRRLEGVKSLQMGTSDEIITCPISSDTSIQPGGSHLDTSSGLVDLVGLQLVVPAILRFRLHHIKQLRIQELVNRCDQNAQLCKEQAKTALTREAAAMQLFFDQDGDIQFGAHLRQGVRRLMQRGSRLLLPHAMRTSTADVQGNNPVAITSWAAVSFENMPSIFLKAREDSTILKAQQSKGDSNSRSSSRRHRVHPFFTCEFAATLTCGSDGGCIFASALATEFFVGMPSFISQPMNCIASAIRATLHRMCLGVTKETLRRSSVKALAQPHTLRMPPLDLALLYVRGSQVYYASTTGIKGKLFFMNSGTQDRCSVDLCKDCLLANAGASSSPTRKVNEGHNTGPLDNSSSTGNTTSLTPIDAGRDNTVPKGGTYDMPTVVRGFVDLSSFASFNMVPSTTSREHSLGSKDNPNAVSMNHLLKKSIRSNPSQTRIVFPLAVVLSCSEFWSAMSATHAVDLLRTLIVLDHEAASYTKALRLEGKADSEQIVPVEEFVEAQRDRAGDRSLEHNVAVQKAKRIREYLNSLDSIFLPDARARMAAFYDNRVKYYIQICKLSKLDSSQIYAEELRVMANERRKGGGVPWYPDPPPSFIDENSQTLHFATRIPRAGLGAPSRGDGDDGQTPSDPLQVKWQGPTAWRDFRRPSTRAAVDEQSLCDALASFLAMEASITGRKNSQNGPGGSHFNRDPDTLSTTVATLTPQTSTSMDCITIPVPAEDATSAPSTRSSDINNGEAPLDVQESSNLDYPRVPLEVFNNAEAASSMEGVEGGEPYSVVVVLLPADIIFADAGRRSRGMSAIHHARRSYSQKQQKQ
ncbi:unnamed protein product [Phytomonas sp. EM1]|nr:unnamed protein product [Phytomonas sp. EM1]|eukprot:CCW62203.1 unnamed protein product [Phytomonas sp. isolate EM1]